MLRRTRLLVFWLAAAALVARGLGTPLQGILHRREQLATGDVRSDTAYFEAFEPARRALGRVPVIGYSGGGPIDLDKPDQRMQIYFWSQYAMVPTLLDRNRSTGLVMVNFPPQYAPQLEQLLRTPGVRLAHRVGGSCAIVSLPENR